MLFCVGTRSVAFMGLGIEGSSRSVSIRAYIIFYTIRDMSRDMDFLSRDKIKTKINGISTLSMLILQFLPFLL